MPAAEVTRVFPGATVQQRGDLDVTVALDHPRLGQADLSWRNEKNGRIQWMHLRPAPDSSLLARQDDLIAW